ncbi:MAG TPA: hypothetical protein DEO70_08075 [Bacteroidales bacterium]|nr:MAG: hypothetical protein A2X11_15950 [Bacteroidetes bacterium GWE2_42_24]OFY29235.1 MAG: hypothetical protein A2X09_05890 [Bacteroidetes bacterium GWF2_43_11]HBZ66781.1 hypothetical protein [Bacteroidales bacterium]
MEKSKRIAIIILWSLLIPAVLVILGFADVNRNQQLCKGIDVEVKIPGDDVIITEAEVLTMVSSTSEPLKGRKISSINLKSIESRIKRNPWIADAAVFPTLSGKLCVKAQPREADIRIINRWGEQYYIDKTGIMYPTRPGFPARVLIASGIINTRFVKGGNVNEVPDSIKKRSILPSVMYLNKYIANDKFLTAIIGQIYVAESGDIELVPITANHTIIIGDTSHLERKFGKLVIFYDKILKTRGWDKYKTVNLKFENQIVCSK